MKADKDICNEIKGQVTLPEVARLRWLASQVPVGGVIVEIGHYKGRSSRALCEGKLNSVRLVDIDPGMCGPKSEQGYETGETLLDYRRAIHPFRRSVTQIIGYPLDVIKAWNYPIDLLFIDATKKKESIYPIWEAWLPFCQGWVASHDYEERYTGVVETIQELIAPITTDHHHIDFTWSGKIRSHEMKEDT